MFISVENNSQVNHCQIECEFDLNNSNSYHHFMNTLQKNIIDGLSAKGWKPYDLSRESGVPQPSIHRIMTGKNKNMKQESVEKIAAAFGVSEAALRGIDAETIALGGIDWSKTKTPDPIKTCVDKILSMVDAEIVGSSYNFSKQERWELFISALKFYEKLSPDNDEFHTYVSGLVSKKLK